jgi:hypothetical protein
LAKSVVTPTIGGAFIPDGTDVLPTDRNLGERHLADGRVYGVRTRYGQRISEGRRGRADHAGRGGRNRIEEEPCNRDWNNRRGRKNFAASLANLAKEIISPAGGDPHSVKRADVLCPRKHIGLKPNDIRGGRDNYHV